MSLALLVMAGTWLPVSVSLLLGGTVMELCLDVGLTVLETLGLSLIEL